MTSRTMSNKTALYLHLLVILLLLAGCARGPSYPPTAPEHQRLIRHAGNFIENSPIKGKLDAPVTLMLFSDFECRYCKEVAQTLRAVARRYPSQVKIVFKHLPFSFHPNARNAAFAATAAGFQGKFWAMHDLLFENQAQLSPETIAAIARKLSLDLKQYELDRKSIIAQKLLARDESLARAWNLRATPTVVANGKVYPGSRSFTDYCDIVEAELYQIGQKKKLRSGQ